MYLVDRHGGQVGVITGTGLPPVGEGDRRHGGRVIALACGPPPEGRARWTYASAGHVIATEGPQFVGLKALSSWTIPPKQNAAFVAAMATSWVSTPGTTGLPGRGDDKKPCNYSPGQTGRPAAPGQPAKRYIEDLLNLRLSQAERYAAGAAPTPIPPPAFPAGIDRLLRGLPMKVVLVMDNPTPKTPPRSAGADKATPGHDRPDQTAGDPPHLDVIGQTRLDPGSASTDARDRRITDATTSNVLQRPALDVLKTDQRTRHRLDQTQGRRVIDP